MLLKSFVIKRHERYSQTRWKKGWKSFLFVHIVFYSSKSFANKYIQDNIRNNKNKHVLDHAKYLTEKTLTNENCIMASCVIVEQP